ncbi:MAG: dUTP diphosphatase [Mesoflavibacter sp.]|nr:dUTP diphosphatase [Mesoflavibacter sp.]
MTLFFEDVKFLLDDENAIMPCKGTKYSAGYDFFACKETSIPSEGRIVIDTGVISEIPEHTYGQLVSKSSLACVGIDVCGGVIDADFRGRIKVILHNHSKTQSFKIEKGQKIAQMIVLPLASKHAVKVEKVNKTTRGTGGFGSTGKWKKGEKDKNDKKPEPTGKN